MLYIRSKIVRKLGGQNFCSLDIEIVPLGKNRADAPAGVVSARCPPSPQGHNYMKIVG